MRKTLKKRAQKKLKLLIKTFLSVDKVLLLIIFLWSLFGFTVFSSAALGLMAKSNLKLSFVLSKQLIALVISFFVMLAVAHIKFQNLLKVAPWFYVFTIFLTSLVFVPSVGFSAGGASRWINVFGYNMQPGEFLKVSVPLFALYLLLKYKKHMQGIYSLLTLAAALLFPVLLLIMQPDTSTTLIVLFATAVIYFLFGSPWKNIFLASFVAILMFTLLIFTRPYVKERILTFMGLHNDPLGSSYQIKQSLIAIGSGGFWGRGFGQGVQKFGYLPEPMGDSIFATLGEEFGFFGAFLLLTLVTLFVLRAFNLARRSRSLAASSTILSLALAIFMQTFVNIAAMSEILPLTGLTLPLFSLGGSSIMATMLAFGVILSAAKGVKRKI